MFLKLFLLFITVPVIEVYFIIRTGRVIGGWGTLGLIILTGVAGSWLAKSQGLTLLAKIQGDLNKGIIPKDSLVDGLLVLISGIVLITPGFLTDGVGILLLIPAFRTMLKKKVGPLLKGQALGGGFSWAAGNFNRTGAAGGFGQRQDPNQVQANWTVESSGPDDTGPDSRIDNSTGNK